MKNYIILIFISLLISCTSAKDITITDLKTYGRIIDVWDVTSEYGTYLYLIQIDGDVYINYISNTEYEFGEWIYIETKINKE